MHVKTLEGAELNGRRFAAGTILDLPDSEAEVLLAQEVAEVVGGEPKGEAETEDAAAKQAGRRRR